MTQTIMAVEDHAIIREGQSVILRGHGYEVIALENGRQARGPSRSRCRTGVAGVSSLTTSTPASPFTKSAGALRFHLARRAGRAGSQGRVPVRLLPGVQF